MALPPPPLPPPPSRALLLPHLLPQLLLHPTHLTRPSPLPYRYNNSIPPELGACIPTRGSAGQEALAVLVANSRALWEPFLEACASQDLLQLDNPLEAYLEQAVCDALADAAPG